jgi:hypothetical protein
MNHLHLIRQYRMNRAATVLAMTLFLAMQLIGAAHYHSPPDVNHLAASTRAAAADQCPICLHHSQTTPALAAASRFVEPRCFVTDVRREPARAVALEVRFALFGRAPPATV